MTSSAMEKRSSIVKDEKGARKRSKSAQDGEAVGALPEQFGRRGYYLAQSPPQVVQMLPFQPIVQPVPHPFVTPLTVGAQHPTAPSGIPLAIYPAWALPFPVRPSFHGEQESSLASHHAFNPNAPHLVVPQNSVAGLRPAPVDLFSPAGVLKTSSAFEAVAFRRESHSSEMDSRHSSMEGVVPVGSVEAAKAKLRLQPAGASRWCDSFSICRKHKRTRKTRLRPDSSLRTGKRKYRCETCTAILEQWTETHGARPTDAKKQELLTLVGMTSRQLNYWFANRRRTERLAHAQQTGVLSGAS